MTQRINSYKQCRSRYQRGHGAHHFSSQKALWTKSLDEWSSNLTLDAWCSTLAQPHTRCRMRIRPQTAPQPCRF